MLILMVAAGLTGTHLAGAEIVARTTVTMIAG
jgi:hypothetical protein